MMISWGEAFLFTMDELRSGDQVKLFSGHYPFGYLFPDYEFRTQFQR